MVIVFMKMRKIYFAPQAKLILDVKAELLTGSTGGTVTGNIGSDVEIGYGGIDEEGNIDPEAKQNSSDIVWDDEED